MAQTELSDLRDLKDLLAPMARMEHQEDLLALKDQLGQTELTE